VLLIKSTEKEIGGRVSAIRCVEQVLMSGHQCQGVDGHDGLHWSYREDGSFCWSDNEYDPKEGGCVGSTPPDHEKYKSPQEMCRFHFHYGNFSGDWEKIHDADLIDKLKRNLESIDDYDLDGGIISPITDEKTIAHLNEVKERNKILSDEFMKGKPRPKKE